MSGVTRLLDVVYVVGLESSTILRYRATTYKRLTDIDVKSLTDPTDIAACEQTSQLYVADSREYVWRISSDGADIKRWLPMLPSDTFTPWSLSVTSTRLLVTSDWTNELRQFDAVGDEVSRLCLPYYMVPGHAMESPTGTFVVSHHNTRLKQWQVSEVNTEGQVLRHFSGTRPVLDRLGKTPPPHIAVDSQGNVFVVSYDSRRILQLDRLLAICCIIIDEHELKSGQPRRLCYVQQSGQLLVGMGYSVAVFDVLRRYR